MGVLSSVVNGAAGLIGQAAQFGFERSEAEKQREWNENMQDKQNAWTLDMWNKQNEYNSPVMQVQRLQEAGLNPAYFGLDGSSASNVQSSQALGYERAKAPEFSNPIQSALSAELLRAQIENTRSDTGLKTNQSESEVARKEQIQAETAKIRQTIQNLLKEGELTDAERAQIQKTLEWVDRLNQAAISSSEAQTSFTKTQERRMQALIPKELLKADADIAQINKAMEEMDANIRKMVAETDLTYEDIFWYTTNHMSSGVFGSGFSLQNLAISMEKFWEDHPALAKAFNIETRKTPTTKGGSR